MQNQEPRGDALEPDAEGVVGGVAAVAQQEHLLLVGLAADGARAGLLLVVVVEVGVVVQPCLRVELGDLFAVLDLVRGESGACRLPD